MLVGPWSDRIGRRIPLITATAVHIVASLAVAISPNIEWLIGFRVVQGLGAAASAVVDSGRAKPEVMREFGIASKSPLDSWCRKYRECGAEALRPKPKGRPKGAEAAPATREQQLEREVRRLEAQVAYLKKSIALKAELGLLPGRGPRP